MSLCIDLLSSRIHADPSKKDTNKREIIRKAYEFALNPPHGIGQDKDSGDIWLDYIQFLTETEASTTWDQQQNMDALRKVYHRAVQIPLDNVGRLWQDLEAFEMKLSRITAKKFMGDLSPAHTQARAVYRQLEKHIKDLYPSTEATRDEIFLPSPPAFSPDDRQLVNKWKAYLKWEENNPLMLDDKDRPLLILRIANVYRKAVIRMRYFSEIWCDPFSFMAGLVLFIVGKVHELRLEQEHWTERRSDGGSQSWPRGQSIEVGDSVYRSMCSTNFFQQLANLCIY